MELHIELDWGKYLKLFLDWLRGIKYLVIISMLVLGFFFQSLRFHHGLWTPREKIAFTAQPKIHSHSQIFRYGRSIFCLPHRPNFSDIFDLCLHWVSVVRAYDHQLVNWSIFDLSKQKENFKKLYDSWFIWFHKW